MGGVLVDYTTIYDFMYYSVLEENNMLTEKDKGKNLEPLRLWNFFIH